MIFVRQQKRQILCCNMIKYIVIRYVCAFIKTKCRILCADSGMTLKKKKLTGSV